MRWRTTAVHKWTAFTTFLYRVTLLYGTQTKCFYNLSVPRYTFVNDTGQESIKIQKNETLWPNVIYFWLKRQSLFRQRYNFYTCAMLNAEKHCPCEREVHNLSPNWCDNPAPSDSPSWADNRHRNELQDTNSNWCEGYKYMYRMFFICSYTVWRGLTKINRYTDLIVFLIM